MSTVLNMLALVFVLYTLTSCGAAGPEYLTHEELLLPTDGRPTQTTKALEAYRVYRVIVSSPYDLSGIERGMPPILFDGEKLPLDGYTTGLYEAVNHLFFLVQGKGIPLRFCLADKARITGLEDTTPSITVEVFRYHWWQARHGRGPHPTLIKVTALIAGIGILAAYFMYFAPGSFRRVVQFFQTHREEVMQRLRPAEPTVRIVRRPPANRPQTPNPIRITHQEIEGENDENHRD